MNDSATPRPPRSDRRSFASEFLIILTGVLVALAIQAAYQGVQNRRTEREYTARLSDELTRGRQRIIYHQTRVNNAIAAIDTLLAPAQMDAVRTARLAVTAANYEYNPAGILHDLTYRELLSTGSMSLIRDLDTRNAITTYYRLAYRAAEVTQEGQERISLFADLVRGATGLPPSTMVQDSVQLPPDARARLAALFVEKRMPDELRVLHSKLYDRSIWIGRLLAGTDTLLTTIGNHD